MLDSPIVHTGTGGLNFRTEGGAERRTWGCSRACWWEEEEENIRASILKEEGEDSGNEGESEGGRVQVEVIEVRVKPRSKEISSEYNWNDYSTWT
jgi:hypothetical protein